MIHRIRLFLRLWKLAKLYKRQSYPCTMSSGRATVGFAHWWEAWRTDARDPHERAFQEAYLSGFLNGANMTGDQVQKGEPL